VFDQLVEVYGTAVLAWAGIDLAPPEARRVSRRLAAIVDGFGFSGAAYLRAWRARVTLDRWAAGQVRDVREGVRRPPPDSALASIAARPDLDARTAGVELLNVLRPTVAVAWPATLAVQRLMVHDGGSVPVDDVRAYVHECRRLQPFAPALAGRVRRTAAHDGVELRRGDRIVLDIIGTDTDPHGFGPDFDPHHFAEGNPPDPYGFVPQGGGHPESGHRCPGEPLAVSLIDATVRAVQRHPLRVVEGGEPDRQRIPTLPDPPLRLARKE
jgi:fatty-acid peroxygenase